MNDGFGCRLMSNVDGLEEGRLGFISNIHIQTAKSHIWRASFVFPLSRRTLITTQITSAATSLHSDVGRAQCLKTGRRKEVERF